MQHTSEASVQDTLLCGWEGTLGNYMRAPGHSDDEAKPRRSWARSSCVQHEFSQPSRHSKLRCKNSLYFCPLL